MLTSTDSGLNTNTKGCQANHNAKSLCELNNLQKPQSPLSKTFQSKSISFISKSISFISTEMFDFLPIFIRVSTVNKFLKVPLSKRRFPKITTGFGPGTFLNNLKFFSNFSYRIHLMNKIKMKIKRTYFNQTNLQ